MSEDLFPRRRASDVLTTTRKALDRSLATTVLVGTMGFLYQMSEILKAHACWCDFKQPPAMGEVAFAIVCGLAAVAASLGLNIGSLLRGFQRPE
jgi:hypothetical protein